MSFATKTLGAVALISAAAAGAAAPASAATAPTADISTHIMSAAPVPGLMTAGQFDIRNNGTTTAATNAVYKITFTDLRGFASLSKHTVTCSSIAYCNVRQDPLDKNSYYVTTVTPLAPGQQITGLWSNHHFLNGTRDKVTISTVNLGFGQVESKPADNQETYDNWGRGF